MEAEVKINGERLSADELRAISMAMDAFALSLEIGDVGGDRARWVSLQASIASVRRKMQSSPR
jgi:hypothetical protein